MTRKPDGSLELVGASGFMPNAGARLLYDGDPDKLTITGYLKPKCHIFSVA